MSTRTARILTDIVSQLNFEALVQAALLTHQISHCILFHCQHDRERLSEGDMVTVWKKTVKLCAHCYMWSWDLTLTSYQRWGSGSGVCGNSFWRQTQNALLCWLMGKICWEGEGEHIWMAKSLLQSSVSIMSSFPLLENRPWSVYRKGRRIVARRVIRRRCLQEL